MRSKAAGVILFRKRAGDGNVVYLVLRNALHRSWGFPKGHLEPGEDDLAAMRRELAEETGIPDVALVDGFRESVRYPVTKPGGGRIEKTVVYYLGESPTETVHLSREHDASRWSPLDEALELIAFDNLRQILRRAHERLEAESAPR